MKLNRDSWRIIETIIMRYPERKKEYEELVEDIIESSGSGDGKNGSNPDYTKPQSVTEAKAMKMLSDKYLQNMKKEIDAVESVFESLNEEEKKVMRIRYWSTRRKKVPYLKMIQCGYSERQMKRIVNRIITQIGQKLGEIS